MRRGVPLIRLSRILKVSELNTFYVQFTFNHGIKSLRCAFDVIIQAKLKLKRTAKFLDKTCPASRLSFGI